MPRDYSKAPHSRGSSSNSPSGMVWLFVGILLGLIIAGTFYLKNQTPRHKPIILPTPATQTNTPTAENPATATTPTTTAPTTKTNKAALQTQFDFYNVLPSQKVVGPSGDEDTSQLPNTANHPTPPATTQTNAVTPTPPAATPAAAVTPSNPPAPVVSATPKISASKPAATNKNPAPSSSTAAPTAPTQYILQVGVFNNFDDADQLKAQLTLTGFDANISSLQKKGQSLQQVWVGPFHSLAEAKTAQQQLQNNQTPSKLLKKS